MGLTFKKFMVVYSYLICIVLPTQLKAEEDQNIQLPETEIYLFDINLHSKKMPVSNMKNISNHKGYDNQPYFTPSNKTILFTSGRDGKQTDIYEYHLASKKLTQITRTAYMEYSPTASDNNQIIAFVRDGEQPDQTIWQLDRKTGKSHWAINSLEPVGYFAMNQKKSSWLYWSRYGFNVTYLNLKNNIQSFISGNAIPSSPKRIPGSNNYSFVQRQSNETVWIKSFNPETRAVTPLLMINGANFDYCWSPDGSIFRTEGTVLYQAKIWGDWKKIADLKSFGLHRISRLAMSSDGKQLAVVDNL